MRNILNLWSLYAYIGRNNLFTIALVDAMLVGVWVMRDGFPQLALIGLMLPLMQVVVLQRIDKLSGAHSMAHVLPITPDQQALAKTVLCTALMFSQILVAMFLITNQIGLLAIIAAAGTAIAYFLSNMIIYSIFE